MKPETKFSRHVQFLLSKIPNTYFFKAQQKSIRGIPDLIICCNGKFLAWELKVGKNKPDPLQEYVMEQICKSHGYAWEVNPKNLEWSIQQLLAIVGEKSKTIIELEYPE